MLDARDIRETYHERPESLKAYFNAASDNRTSDSLLTLSGMAMALNAVIMPWTLIVTVPAVAAILYSDHHAVAKRQEQIGDAVRRDVEEYRAAKVQSAVPAHQPA